MDADAALPGTIIYKNDLSCNGEDGFDGREGVDHVLFAKNRVDKNAVRSNFLKDNVPFDIEADPRAAANNVFDLNRCRRKRVR